MNIWARLSVCLMRYELLLSAMRRVLLLVFLLLIPAAWAEETESYVIEVEDPFGNPISGCNIELKEPWTGTVIQTPGTGMYQPSATCDGYAVMWHPPVPSSQTTVILQAHPIIEDLFTVEGAHTITMQGSTWQESVSDGSVNAPNGVPLFLIGDGGIVMRTGESSIVIPNATTTYDLQGNYSDDVSVKAIHTASGVVEEWVDQNLTIGEHGGGWVARVYSQGLPLGESSWPPTVQWIEQQLNSSKIAGAAKIEFTSGLDPNTNVQGIWSASHKFNNGLGLPFIPGVMAGVESQVDRFLGGDVNQLEAMLDSIFYFNGIQALCCLIDDSPVMFSNLQIESSIDFSTGFWGWNESAEISADRSSINIIRFEVPFQNDLRQTTPLTIQTTGDWQYISSPLNEWINGAPNNFTLQRDDTSISGYYTISLGPNSAPVLSMSENYALPWDNTSYDFEVIIEDAPLSIHTCQWNISGSSVNYSVNLSTFDKDSNLPISVTCTDEGGLAGNYSTSLILDGGSPWINESGAVREISPGDHTWNLNVGDDHDQNPNVYWTSNKSDDWWDTGKLLQTKFSVDSNLNSINDNISERHKSRNQVEYWLSAEVSDDVGHTVIGNWTIRLLDSSGPIFIANLESLNENGDWEKSTSISRPGDELRLNFTESFDDHSSIDKIIFSIEIQNEVYSNLSWSEFRYWELPELPTGYHEIKVTGIDEAGNPTTSNVAIAIAPPIARNLEITGITSSSTDIEPGINKFWVTIQNNGASSTEFILCNKDDCIESIIGPSTYSQTATVIVAMEVDMDWFETFSVELSYLDDANQTVVKHSTSEYNSGIGLGGFELFVIVAIGVLAVLAVRSRNKPRF